jgi:NADH-quinone oxidoreductase subunit M
MSTLLLTTILLPAAGAVLAQGGRAWARRSALVTAAITLALAAVLAGKAPGDGSAYALVDLPWLGPWGSRFSLGLDGLGLWLFALAALLPVVAVLVSWEAVVHRAAGFYGLLLILESGMLGVFAARDVLVFYVFFEFTLVPLFFLIGVWGGEDRRQAALKFFLFTFAGSMLVLLGLVAIVLWDYSHWPTMRLTFSIPELARHLRVRPIDQGVQLGIFLVLSAGFAVKVPLVPLDMWLPPAHAQAPTAGSVVLSGAVLNVGAYGFLRFGVSLLPEAAVRCMPWLWGLSLAGILYGALAALAQQDIKRLVAYSSVSQMGYCMLGVFALNPLGLRGGLLQMLAHGLSAGGLFAVAGMLYERYHTHRIKDMAGLAAHMPLLAFFAVLFALSGIGLPGLGGFAGQLLVLLGAFHRGWTAAPPEWAVCLRWISVSAVFGVPLAAWYMLQLVRRVFFGRLRFPEPQAEAGHVSRPVGDLAPRELAALGLLAVFIVWIGVYPRFFLKRMAGAGSGRQAAGSGQLSSLPAARCLLPAACQLPPGESYGE